MQTISIQTNNAHTIRAIQALIKLDPSAIMTTTYDEPSDLSQKDEQILQQLSDLDDKGELEFYSDDEVKEFMAQKGHKW